MIALFYSALLKLLAETFSEFPRFIKRVTLNWISVLSSEISRTFFIDVLSESINELSKVNRRPQMRRHQPSNFIFSSPCPAFSQTAETWAIFSYRKKCTRYILRRIHRQWHHKLGRYFAGAVNYTQLKKRSELHKMAWINWWGIRGQTVKPTESCGREQLKVESWKTKK